MASLSVEDVEDGRNEAREDVSRREIELCRREKELTERELDLARREILLLRGQLTAGEVLLVKQRGRRYPTAERCLVRDCERS